MRREGARAELHRRLSAEGGLLAAALGTATPSPSKDDLQATAATRANSDPRALVLEAVAEAQRLHHGDPELLTGADADLALLAGDRLYALGLAELIAAGDLEAVAALAELIARTAEAQTVGDREARERAWETAEGALRTRPEAL